MSSRKPRVRVHRVSSGVHAQRAPLSLRLVTARYAPVRRPLNLNLSAQPRRREDWDDWVTIRCTSPDAVRELSVWIPTAYDKTRESAYSSPVYSSGFAPSEIEYASDADTPRASEDDGLEPEVAPTTRSPVSCGVEGCAECYSPDTLGPAGAVPSSETASPVVLEDEGERRGRRRYPRPLASFATHHSNGSDASADIGLALRMPLASAPAVITTFPLSSPTVSEFSVCPTPLLPPAASAPATPQGAARQQPTSTFPRLADVDVVYVDASRCGSALYAPPSVHSPLGATSFSFINDLDAASLPDAAESIVDDDATLPIIDESGERSGEDTDDDEDDLELNTPRHALDLGGAARSPDAVDVAIDGTATVGRGRMGRAIKSIQSFGSLRTARSLTSLRSRLTPRKTGAEDDVADEVGPPAEGALPAGAAPRRSFSFLRRPRSQLWQHASAQDAAEEGERALREHLEKTSQRRDRRISALRLRGFM